jgi:hypothetical protein
MTKGIIPQLTPNTLSIISIDNVDILQPHSMVSTLGSHTWHGTSVQCTQPRPVTIKLENDEPTIEPMCTGISYAESAPSKRGYSSPIESPIPKQHSKRLRTFTECSTFSSTVSVDMTQIHLHHNVEYCPSPLSYFTIADFKLISMESQRLEKIKNTVFKYIITKRFSDDKNNYPSMYYFVSESNYGRLNTEKSQIHFMNVFSLKADCQDTVIFILHQIYNKFICSQSLKWVVVVGDAKTYDILQKVKREQCLSWLIVFPGDWHILYNYQKVLMKVYWDAGLMQLAQAAGYKGEALTSLSKASNFRRTHDFLLQVYEAFVSTFAENFLSQHSEIETSEIQLLATALTKAGTSDDLSHAIKNVLDYHSKQANVHEQFSSYIRDTVQSSKTQVFWKNFVEFDVFAYVSLFIAIRNSDWQLRLASLKTMAAIFFAFDRPIYQRLVSTHLTDILQMPNELKKYFDDNGAFSVHITSRANHATALDETHEMCINRIIKNIVKRPNPELIEHASYAYPFRNACQSQLKQELGMDVQNTNEHKGLKITNVNIRRMIDLIETKKVLSSDDTGRLANMFSATMATADQEHDLLSFRQVGQAEFENHIEFKILHKPSAKTPSRLKRLKTFSVSKQTKQKASQINKENKIIQSCIQKQLALCRSGQFNSSINPPYIPLPRALVTADGFPHKGNKSNITNFFKSRYKDLNVVSSYFPSNWIPDSVLLEGMFLIQTVPSLGVDSYSNYCQMVASRFILPHFKNGVKEVHVIFDSENNETESHHEHQDITENGTIPSNWRVDVIHCRICKKSLCYFLSQHMLKIIPQYLNNQQTFVCSGGISDSLSKKCISVDATGENIYLDHLESNSEETDLRIWLHCKHAQGANKLIYSPDTDIYHIGLSQSFLLTNDVYIQQRPSIHENARFLSMSLLIEAINSDPDLAYIPVQLRSNILQTLYVATGCDYISFFKGIGKLFFMQVYFQHAKFISSGLEAPGTLADTHDNNDLGFLAFIRLVGSSYFTKHKTGFIAVSPSNLYNTHVNIDVVERHKQWLTDIRETVWKRIANEEYALPSWEALFLHWKRSTWIIGYWKQASHQYINMPSKGH